MFTRHRQAAPACATLLTLSSRAEHNDEQSESFCVVEGPCVQPGALHMRDEYIYYVYMMQSPSRRALYIGMTNNLRKRVWEHKNHIREGFSDDYNCTRLVYWESYDDVIRAIHREKQLKRWRREKKWLIERKNPQWQDLAADWYPAATQGPSTAHDLSKNERSCSARDDTA